MRLPFTSDQFFAVFAQYNVDVWPLQWVLIAAALGVLLLALARAPEHADRIIGGILAALWAWMGIVYHLAHFRAINPAAVVFGALFVAEAVVLGVALAWRGGVRFRFRPDAWGVAGAVVLAYALAGYPVVAYALGHRYPAMPTFGLPCPTTLFTLGVLLWARPSLPRGAAIIPLLWAFVGTTAALQLGVREDLGLPVAAVLVVARLIADARRPAAAPPPPARALQAAA